MDFKEGSLKVARFLFPIGNYRWYIWFIPATWGTWVTLAANIIIMDILLYGNWISTDTFSAHITSDAGNISPIAISFITVAFNALWYLWIIFCVWLAISLLVDILYGLYRAAKLAYAFLWLLTYDLFQHGDR